MPRKPDETAVPDEVKELHATALVDIDAVLESAATLRGELRAFETALRRARNQLARGATTQSLHRALDITEARDALTQAAADFQTQRHASRVSVFRAQVAEGMSLGEIARSWGLSRQLVSRTLRDADAERGS